MARLDEEASRAFEEAKQLRDAGDLSAAVEILQRLEIEAPGNAAILVVLGDVLQDLDRLAESVAAFQRARQLQPRHSLVSGGLFWALRDAGRLEEARDEAQRFIALVEAGVVKNPPADLLDDYRAIVTTDLETYRATVARFDRLRVLPGFKTRP